eukprot:SAG31_NODE_88_length_26714_cov_6.972046_17_plen_322_part_00
MSVVTFSFLCQLFEKYGIFIARCNALIEKVSSFRHRSLKPKKLIEVGFSRLQERMTMSRLIKLLKLPVNPQIPSIRPMVQADVPQVCKLLNAYLSSGASQMNPVFDEEEVAHWFTPREDVVYCYVVESEAGDITDFLSFYTLPSTVIGNPKHSNLKAAYSFYNVNTSCSLEDLLRDALILAVKHDFDVFNALDIFQNAEYLKTLKFGTVAFSCIIVYDCSTRHSLIFVAISVAYHCMPTHPAQLHAWFLSFTCFRDWRWKAAILHLQLENSRDQSRIGWASAALALAQDAHVCDLQLYPSGKNQPSIQHQINISKVCQESK